MKCLEGVIKRCLCLEIDHIRDPLQFAYRQRKSVQDAVLTLIHDISKHLENRNSQARILFIDFSSAFNSIQTHILFKKLLEINVNTDLLAWIYLLFLRTTSVC